MEFKQAHKEEIQFNDGSEFGIQINVALGRELNENDQQVFDKAADMIKEELLKESERLDPAVIAAKTAERKELLSLFDGQDICVEELPNGYCSHYCCSQKPWYRVTTKHGPITLGWRKRVIEISWLPSVAETAMELFPREDVTKDDRLIHAWGYDKAKEYIDRLLASNNDWLCSQPGCGLMHSEHPKKDDDFAVGNFSD